MNTLFSYQYRDAENYKISNDVIIDGVLFMDEIKNYLYESQFFIPSEVGLDDLQQMPLKSYDHIWHEILDISSTSEPSRTQIKANQFISCFKIAKSRNWNQFEVFKRKGLI